MRVCGLFLQKKREKVCNINLTSTGWGTLCVVDSIPRGVVCFFEENIVVVWIQCLGDGTDFLNTVLYQDLIDRKYQLC